MPLLFALAGLSLLHGSAGLPGADDEATSCLQVRQVQESEAVADLDADMDADLDAELDVYGINKNRPHPPGGGSNLDLKMLIDDHQSECSTVFLTTIFNTRRDPQRHYKVHTNFKYFERYYESVLALPGGRAKAIIFHDSLPDALVDNYTTPDGTMSFVKVDLDRYEPNMGLNDLRFLLFEEQIKQHPEWDTVFMTDGHDVVVVHNPCTLVETQPDKVFVGSQARDHVRPKAWFKECFIAMGQKYLDWYFTKPVHQVMELNAGIFGGKRGVVLKAIEKLNTVLMDPDMGLRKRGDHIEVNMAAFNYVFRGELEPDIVTGYPLHSKWNKYENRSDVYFWHH